MIRTKTIALAFLAALLALGGCASHEDSGAGIGAVAGGLIGSGFGRGEGRVAATLVGAVIGGIVGSEVGRRMDRRDRELAEEAEYDALERGSSGRARIWRNDRNGNYGEIVPSRPYRRGDYDCRDYTHTVYMDGRPEVVHGTACRDPDGRWRTA